MKLFCLYLTATLTAGLLSGGTAAAQDASHCVGIDNPDDRLNCFDEAFIESSAPAQPSESEWSVREERSRLDDTRTVYLSVRSQETVRTPFGQTSHLTLHLRCRENTTSMFIGFAGHFMADIQGKGRLDYRIDDRPARHVNTNVSTDNKALGLWRGSSAIPFVKSMFDGDELYVRATPFSESPVEAVFPITGTEAAVVPLREACNW